MVYVTAIGLVYLGCTFASNLAYLNVLSASLANDFGWAGFNTSGMHVFLANTINRQLVISTRQNLVLDSPSLSDTSQLYNGSATTIAWFPSNANRELFSTHNTLQDIILGLREMDPCALPWMFTQYCWLDLDWKWEMASSNKRQQRCLSEVKNGAKKLFTQFKQLENADVMLGTSFQIGFGHYLNTFQYGQTWMHSIQFNTNSVDEEAHYWMRHGITSFKLQWQNYKTLGLVDSMTISTALGMSYQLPLSLSQGMMHFHQQTTSIRMYWAFAGDLWAITSNTTSVKGMGLLRESPNFAFYNTTSTSLLVENTTLIAPLSQGLVQTASTLGPFGNIDMEYILCPSNLVEMYDAVRSAISNLTLLSLSAQSNFINLPLKAQIGPAPTDLLARSDLIAGGNIFCGDDAPAQPTSYGLDISFGKGKLCHWLIFESITPSTIELLFTFLALGRVNSSELIDICNLDALQEPNCVAIYNSSLTYLQTYSSSFTHLTALIPSIEVTVYSINVTLVQFLQGNGTTLYTLKIMDKNDPPWTFYGWCFLFEWASGQREVFQGDISNLTLLSARSDPLSMALSPNNIPVQIAYIFQRCAQYVTLVLIGVAFLLAFYGLLCRGHIEGLNLFEMNRIVGYVCVGRSLLIIITAVRLLNTSPQELVQIQAATQITSPRLSWYKTFLAASELTWFVYMLNDVLSFLTKSYTTYYAMKSSILTWSIAIIYTIISPQVYEAKLDRSCIFIDMDMQLVCNSAFISIGSFSRTASDIGIAVGSVLIAASVEALRRSKPKALDVPVGFLSSTSFYLFDFTDWIDQDECYLDQASAAMAGLLTLRYRSQLYIFDIKTWRCYACTTDRCMSRRWGDEQFSAVIPLNYVASSLEKS
ncbi:hypothetical protein THRCLA_09541 [Thraustotheca clavata]|uniref:Uncharacterized protein n=1 Tax=Thraustotheca clavata TaxID=74557 RepID=A0A1V9YVV3_9STRA|nr:hypothetical protein THRCLA_09541 [Thraustotheca clavata]